MVPPPPGEPEPRLLPPTSRLTRTQTKHQQRQQWRHRIGRRLAWIGGSAITALALLLAGGWVVGYHTPWGSRARMVLAETIISTRHYYLAKYITSPAEYASLVQQLNAPIIDTGVTSHVKVIVPQAKPYEIHAISGPGWKGFVMLVYDPRRVRLVAADVHGALGEYITDMEKRVGTVAGVNASGFEDPNGEGWGGLAVGLEYVGGREISNSAGAGAWPVVGFNTAGVMVMGNYTLAQLQQLGVRDAMQFHPELVVNGQPLITSGDGGWGYGPRTAIGQTKNGTVIFVVTDGRFHGGGGMGASQRQVMNVMLQYGAVNACAMDGGSSSVIVQEGQILNSPSTIDPHGQRHLPDAWMVFPSAAAATAYTP